MKKTAGFFFVVVVAFGLFFSPSLPLFQLAQSAQEGYGTYRLTMVSWGTHWGAEDFNRQSLQTKIAACAVPFHYGKP